jgi:hypothetical protein
LLELLIALALSGLLLALLSQTLGELQFAARRVIGADAAADRDERCRQLLAGLLAGVLPPKLGEEVGGFSGGPDGAEFTADPPQALRRMGPLHVRLLVASTTGTELGLFLEARPDTAGGGAGPTRGRELLLAGLRSVRFAYLAGSTPDYTPEDRWNDKGQPPAMVQVFWRLTNEVEERAPVTAAIRRTVPGGCRFDPIGLVCEAVRGG